MHALISICMLQFKLVNCLSFLLCIPNEGYPNVCSFSGCNPAAGTLLFPGNTFTEASVSNKKKVIQV